MKSILNELFHGKIYPFEQIVSQDPEYLPLNRKIADEREFFKGMLSEDNFKRLQKMEAMYTDSSAMQDVTAFSYGFRLGAALMIEVLTTADDLIDSDSSDNKGE